MKKTVGAMTLLVKKYVEAISFYADKLGFCVFEDLYGNKWDLLETKPRVTLPA